MKTRIAIYGGTNLSPERVQFVYRLTDALLELPKVVLLSGGFRHFKNHKDHTSVDLAVLNRSQERIPPEQFANRFETFVPALDRPHVVRFEEGTVHKLAGTSQSRRFTLVKTTDAVITIGGEGNTWTVLELALALGKPALPIEFSGGDSKRIWKHNRDALMKHFQDEQQLIDRLKNSPMSAGEAGQLASDVAKAIYEVAEKRCLVLMPFGPGDDDFYENTLSCAIEKANYIDYRIDKKEYSGNIPALFISSLDRAHAIVVDVTGANPNVMYELGQVHARGIRPMIIRRTQLPTDTYANMPFYLHNELVVSAPDDEAGHKFIACEVVKYLNKLTESSFEASRR